MDTNKLLHKLNNSVPGMILKKSRFGKAEIPCLWVDIKSILQVGEALRADTDLGLDLLENFSVAEVGDSWLVTYFFRSSVSGDLLVLRASCASPAEPDERVELPSVSALWPMIVPMEREAAELFGIRFEGGIPADPARAGMRRLPDPWVGFPLRKMYVFPREYAGIQHYRPKESPEHAGSGADKPERSF